MEVGNIPENVTPLVNYSYLANGAKLSAFDGNGEGLMYRGPFVYRKSSDSEGNSSLTLESAAFGGGRLTPARAMLYVTDYLGSVRAVVDGNTGELYKAVDYSTFGEENAVMVSGQSGAGTGTQPLAAATLPDGTTLRDGYTGKEDQTPDFSTSYTDFGARQYNSLLRRWMTPDPMSEKYYGISPYAFCNNNPVNLVDPDGRDPIYSKNFWGKVEYIGDDGKNSIGAYLVSGSVSRDVKRATKHNTYYNGDLSAGKNVIHIPTGELLNGIKKSYEDTQLSKRENGGHYNFGDTEVTRWDEGDAAISYIDQNGNKVVKASMKMFIINGENLSPSDASNVQYWWHVHPDLSIDNINLGSSNPSLADYRAQSEMNKKKYDGISFVIGAGDKKVSFFNSKRVLRTIKWSDFIKMGEQKR